MDGLAAFFNDMQYMHFADLIAENTPPIAIDVFAQSASIGITENESPPPTFAKAEYSLDVAFADDRSSDDDDADVWSTEVQRDTARMLNDSGMEAEEAVSVEVVVAAEYAKEGEKEADAVVSAVEGEKEAESAEEGEKEADASEIVETRMQESQVSETIESDMEESESEAENDDETKERWTPETPTRGSPQKRKATNSGARAEGGRCGGNMDIDAGRSPKRARKGEVGGRGMLASMLATSVGTHTGDNVAARRSAVDTAGFALFGKPRPNSSANIAYAFACEVSRVAMCVLNERDMRSSEKLDTCVEHFTHIVKGEWTVPLKASFSSVYAIHTKNSKRSSRLVKTLCSISLDAAVASAHATYCNSKTTMKKLAADAIVKLVT